MLPSDIAHIATIGRPVLLPDGSVLASVTRPDPTTNRSVGNLVRTTAAGDSTPFTHGDQDRAPVLSPDGTRIAFLRGGGADGTQVCEIPVYGGDTRVLAAAPLSVSSLVFTPDSNTLIFAADVPEAGRYGTDSAIKADAEAPRRITRLDFHEDGHGFLQDKAAQLFVVDLIAAETVARQLTADPEGAAHPVPTEDGRAVRYVRGVGPNEIAQEIATIDLAVTEPGTGEVVVRPGGSVAALTAHSTGLLLLSVSTTDPTDYTARTCGLFHWDAGNGRLARLTDADTVDIDAAAGPPVVLGDQVLVAVQHRGAVELRSVPTTADNTPLAELRSIIGGQISVREFTVVDGSVAAVVADASTPGDLVLTELQCADVAGITDYGAAVRAVGLARQEELTATASDGYPVHGFLMLPPTGDGPFPVLLDIHGGPHAAYTWGWFDEAQMYANAGYAVVLPNPRGSSGYGQAHGRAVRGAMGVVDVDDVLSLLDAALARNDTDSARVGVMGGSYGGLMTTLLAGKHGERFTAAISERAVNAWDSFVGSSDIGWFFPANYIGTTRDELWAGSPLASADGIDIPFLIMHSEQDWRCPVEQAYRLFASLKMRGAEVEMLLFPGEGHELSRSGRPQHRVQRFEAILEWWSRHLPTG